MDDLRYIDDADLDPETRAVYSEFTTPRNVQGHRWWPADELPQSQNEDGEPEGDGEDEPETDPPPPPADDAIVQEARRRQDARRMRHAKQQAKATARTSRWAHVPLVDLFRDAGNSIYQRAQGGDRMRP
jgi:hypothetical protein